MCRCIDQNLTRVHTDTTNDSSNNQILQYNLKAFLPVLFHFVQMIHSRFSGCGGWAVICFLATGGHWSLANAAVFDQNSHVVIVDHLGPKKTKAAMMYK